MSTELRHWSSQALLGINWFDQGHLIPKQNTVLCLVNRGSIFPMPSIPSVRLCDHLHEPSGTFTPSMSRWCIRAAQMVSGQLLLTNCVLHTLYSIGTYSQHALVHRLAEISV